MKWVHSELTITTSAYVKMYAGDYFFNIKGVDTFLNCFGNYQTARLITTLLGGKNGDLYFKFTEINS